MLRFGKSQLFHIHMHKKNRRIGYNVSLQDKTRADTWLAKVILSFCEGAR